MRHIGDKILLHSLRRLKLLGHFVYTVNSLIILVKEFKSMEGFNSIREISFGNGLHTLHYSSHLSLFTIP